MGAFDGKTLVINGGGKEKSVGYGVARAFAREGANICIAGTSRSKLKASRELEDEFGVHVTTRYVSEPSAQEIDDAIASFAQAFGSIDVLVCCLQAAKVGDMFEHVRDAELEHAVQAGPLLNARWMRACFPHLKKSHGCVINFVSDAAHAGQEGFSTLALADGAVRSLSRVVAHEWEPYAIRVNTVSTHARTSQLERWSKQFPEDFEDACNQNSIDGFSDVETDVGAACVRIASGADVPASGQHIVIN